MKPFNLKEYLDNPSRKVVTRDGRPVRIICTDANCDNPIVALVTAFDNSEVIYSYTKDGLISSCGECNLDLSLAPKKKECFVNIFKETDDIFCSGNIYDTKEEAEFYRGDNPKYVATTKITWDE